MTSAITAVESLSSLASLDPAGAAAPAQGAAVGTQAPGGLGERFSQALEQARLVPEQGAHVHGPSAVSQAVSAQDETFQALTTKLDAFEASSGTLSIQQMAAQSLQIYVGTAVAQGGKSTVQTLMKNQ